MKITTLVETSIRTLFRDLYQRVQKTNLGVLASSLSYTTVFSLVPILALVLTVLGGFLSLDRWMGPLENWVLEYVTPGVSQDIIDEIRYAIQKTHRLAFGGISLLFLLFSSVRVFMEVENAVNSIWQVEKRFSTSTILVRYLIALGLGPIGFALVLAILTSTSFPLSSYASSRLTSVVLFFLVFVVAFRFLPHTKSTWKFAAIASLISAVAIGIAQSTYLTLIKNMFSFSKIYGPLAAIPIFLFWVQINWWIFLLGVTLHSVLEQRRK